jgi:MSHA biogenesis protein MshI
MQMGWLLPRKFEPGWMAVSLQPTEFSIAHGRREPGARPLISQIAAYPIEAGRADAAKVLAQRMRLDRFHCETLMSAGEYQLLTVEAPNVPPAELKAAIRWSVQGLIDFHIDDATIDVLDIPPEPGSSGAAHAMYAVVARNELVKHHIDRFHEAAIPLSVIDIAETAQRNIGVLCEATDERAVALLYAADTYSLLTVNFKGELYLARRIELGLEQLFRHDEDGAREGGLNRILLEVRRTFDVFERQYHFVPVEKLVIAPEPKDSGMRAYLAENLDLPVASLELGEIVDFADGLEPDLATQWKHFHLIGAALRQDSKAL